MLDYGDEIIQMSKVINGLKLKAGLVLAVVSTLLILVAVQAKAESYEQNVASNLIAQQHRADACVLGAVATQLNYVTGGRNYTSAGLALAYKLKFGKENWAQDGNTSHEAQMLAADAGFKVEIGKMQDWGGVAALKYLAWAKRYPVVFLNGSVQHAVTVLALLDDNTLLVADPWTGTTFTEQPETFYTRLEPQKWYFTTHL